MASANFTVNGNAAPPEIAVAASSVVNLALLSTSGCDVIEWSIIGSHSHLATNPAITPAGTPLGAVATFTMPAGAGQGYLVQGLVNGGVDSEGVEQSALRKTAIVGVLNSRGAVPLVFGETFERSATHGTTEALNALASPAGVGTGDTVGPAGATAGNLAALDATGKVLSDSGVATANVRLARRAIQAYAGASNDLALADAAKFVTTSHGSACSLRLRLQSAIAWLSETEHVGCNVGAGALTITAEGGVTLNGSATVAANGWFWLKRTGTNIWQCSTGGSGGSGDLKADGTVAMTADLNLGGNQASNAGDAAGATDLTTLQQVNALIAAAVAGAGGGGGDGFSFTFDVGTTDADPTAGKLRINNATPGLGMTQIFVDLADTSGNDITAWLDRLDDSIGSVKGYVRVGSKSDKTKWLLFALTSVTSATGYRKLGVTYVAGPALPLTTAGDCFLSFESLGLIGLITNALIDPAAAIAWSKLATAIGNIGFTGLKHLVYTVVANGTVGATPTIDLTAGTDHTLTLGVNTTLAFTAPPVGVRFRLRVTQGTSPWTLAFPGSVTWVGNPRRLGTGSGEVTYYEGEYNGTNYVMDGDIPSRLAPRGPTNVEIDLYPASVPASTTLSASGGTVVVDFPLVAGKVYSINWRIAVGPASGQVAFLETDLVHAQLVSGAAVILKADVTTQLALSNLSVAFTVSTVNVRMTVTNASGTSYKATVQAGAVISDLPS